VLGAAFGAAVTWCVERVPLHIEGIINAEHFIVAWEWEHYVLAVLTAVIVVMVASVIPARRAARLEPGDVIRGSAA
jgi:lipoprotein-releasing system permease protein